LIWTLLIETQDKKGLIFEISQVLVNNSLNIENNSEFVDTKNNRFFMRTQIQGKVDEKKLKQELKKVLQGAKLELKKVQKKDVVIFCTKEPHAIGDLLIKHQFGALNANIKAVISNHETLRDLVEKFKIAFHYVDDKNKSRKIHETEILKILEQYSFDYIILAKYMRILTPEFVKIFANKIINIHHSFLPAFIGANPYKQAWERGVKIIGATSHFVNASLDEGPIIYQDVTSVDHTFTPEDMALKGKEIETIVLANALRLVFEDRVFVYNNKTVVL